MNADVETPIPQVKAAQVRRLVAILKRSGEWMTRRELAIELGDASPAFERRVRAIASVAAPVVVSFPGSPGYRHFEACSEEEIEHCVNAFRSSGTDQIKRGNLYLHALNRRRTHRGPQPVQVEMVLR